MKRMLLLITTVILVVSGCATNRVDLTLSTPTAGQVDLPTIETPVSLPGDTRVRLMDGMVMIYVPTGEFDMGSNDEEVEYALGQCLEYDTNCNRSYFSVEQPVHTVELDGFWIDKTEVTNDQYEQCKEAGVCSGLGCQDESQPGGAHQPVVCVTWIQAEEYCEWVGARLPTEAEWEYAARGPERRRYPWGDEFDGKLLNYCDTNCTLGKSDQTFNDGYIRSAPVGSYPQGASWVGALDMAGNVWELVADWNGEYSPERQVNPTGPSLGTRRVARGGSWHASPDHVRCALRTNLGADEFADHVGFRCVTSVP